MDRDQGANIPENPWPRLAWWLTAGVVVVTAVVGFAILGRYQQNGPQLDWWAAICRAIGITSASGPAGAPQPPLQTPTRIAWTEATLAQIEAGSVQHGATVAANCTGCHGPNGVSAAPMFPTLAGMDAAVIYKQLDDFRSGKRDGGVMNANAAALNPEDLANVAAFFAGQKGGLLPIAGEPIPEGGRSLRQSDPALRLVFAGDPQRGIPPCSSCHGPGGHKLGAPPLQGQHREYLERQLEAFAQSVRRNDIGEQMRVIANQLTAVEIHAIAGHYAAQKAAPTVVSQR
ncbi:MAG: cytochrome c4 [Hyphomicrobiales bacterium]|nr:cytochrome c4 [Hyphomicrobiales bacterium]